MEGEKMKRDEKMKDAIGIAEGWIEAESEEQIREAWQYLVDTGTAWKLQGSFGRQAQRLLDAGLIEYPEKRTFDYYGNPIPTKIEVKK